MLYITGFIIAFLGMYVFLVQSAPTATVHPAQPSPGLQDDSAKEPDYHQMLNQVNDEPADDTVRDTALIQHAGDAR
jgi:hypothetical protein